LLWSCPCEASRAIAGWPDEVSRPYCLSSAIGEASRRNAGLADMRSIAASDVFASSGAPECLRRQSRQFAADGTQRRGSATCEADAKVEWSGCKAGESAVGRGRNSAEAVRDIWRTAPARTAALGAKSAELRSGAAAPKRKCPLCDAGCWDATHEADRTNKNCPAGRRPIPARRGCYSENEERSDEASIILPRERPSIDA
jgi:hypothetical protein